MSEDTEHRMKGAGIKRGVFRLNVARASKTGEEFSFLSRVLVQKGSGNTRECLKCCLGCGRKGELLQEKNALTLTCEQETAECHSTVGLGWTGPKKNLENCRASQQCGFGVDWPQKQPQLQLKMQGFTALWLWDGFAPPKNSKAAEFHSSVDLRWISPKNNLKSCRVSQQWGFGVDWPPKEPQKLQSFTAAWMWGGLAPKNNLSQKPRFCF